MGDTNLGIRLKQAREKAKLTQSDVCPKAGISKPQIISNYERGASSPPLETLKALSRLYGVSTDWLLFGQEYTIKNVDLKTFLHFLIDHSEKFFRTAPGAFSGALCPKIGYNELSPEERRAFGVEPWSEHRVTTFFENWGKFLELKNSGALNQELYETCINGLIDEYAPEIQNLIDASEYISHLFDPDDI